MDSRLTPPDWGAYDSNMLINVGDMKYYYENFTDIVDGQTKENKNSITNLDGRVAKLEHSIPIGPGGQGAFKDLGGVPGDYPTAEQMEAPEGKESYFMVVAHPNGLYYYNPANGILIPPKDGGGNIAVHGQFPQIYDAGHKMTHNGRMDLSGVYTANVAEVGLSTHFPSNPTCKVLIVVDDAGEEYQTAFSPDGMASRTFRAGEQSTPWVVSSGGGSGGGDVSKADLISGNQLVNWNSLGSDIVTTADDVTSANMASSPVVIGVGNTPGKKFIMADIADKTVTNLASTQVREGRVTYIVNMGSAARSVELTGGCRFNMNGGLNTTTKQTIPAKAAWFLAPSINAGGEKIWSFMGSISTENIDVKDLIDRLEALEAGGGGSGGGVTSFTGLTDTPTDYAGQGNRFLAVKADESGVEFVTTPSIDVKPLEDRIDLVDQNIANHVADFELMRDGHIPTSWNGLGARPITTPNDVTVADIAESPFVIGTGTVAGKKFILPDIAELGVMSLGSGQVREGRATYLVNLGNVDRVVEVTSGCKINITGGAVFDSQIIPRKTAWMMSPGVFAGDKVWTFLGALSAETLDIAGLLDRLDAVENRRIIENFTDLADTPADYRPGHVLRYNQAGTAVTSSEFALKHLSDTPSDYTGQKGKMLVVNNGETAMEFMTVPDHDGLQDQIDDNHNSIITLQNMDTVQGNSIADLETRVTDLEDSDPSAGITSGDFPVSISSTFGNGETSWDTISQARAAKTQAVFFWGNSNGKQITLPDIADETVNPLPANTVRAGRLMFISNRSTTSKTIKVANSCQFLLGGAGNTANTTDIALGGGNATLLMAHKSGDTKRWAVMGVFPADQTVNMSALAGTISWKGKVETGDSSAKVNSNCLFGAMQIKDGALSASELAACTAGYVIGTVARTCTLPKVVDVNASSLAAEEARFGKQIRMVNMSTQTMNVNVHGGGRIYKPDNNYGTTVSISSGKYADFHAVWWPGGGFNNFAWIMMTP